MRALLLCDEGGVRTLKPRTEFATANSKQLEAIPSFPLPSFTLSQPTKKNRFD